MGSPRKKSFIGFTFFCLKKWDLPGERWMNSPFFCLKIGISQGENFYWIHLILPQKKKGSPRGKDEWIHLILPQNNSWMWHCELRAGDTVRIWPSLDLTLGVFSSLRDVGISPLCEFPPRVNPPNAGGAAGNGSGNVQGWILGMCSPWIRAPKPKSRRAPSWNLGGFVAYEAIKSCSNWVNATAQQFILIMLQREGCYCSDGTA